MNGIQSSFLHSTIAALAICCSRVAVGEIAFERDIAPIFKESCSGCHYPPAEKLKSKFDLSTLEGLLEGGAEGVAIVPGRSAESPLVAMIEGNHESPMPPKGKGDPLKPDQIALIKQWIDDGAKGGVALAEVAPAVSPPAESGATAAPAHEASVSALAYGESAGELLLAEGRLHTVDVYSVDKQSGAIEKRFTLEGHAEAVRALDFSPDGALLAAAGGLPGRKGEVKIWRTADQTQVRTIEGHNDNILDAEFSPDGKLLATCAYDRLVYIWDVESGQRVHELKNHVDAVYSLAFSPDGKTLVTGAGDRTVKVWDTATGKLLVTLADATDIIYAVAYSPKGDMIAGAGADKSIRTWSAVATGETLQQTRASAGQLLKATFAHDGGILGLAFSPDGATLYSTSEDKHIKAWDSTTLTEKQVFELQPDWVTALDVDPSGRFLVAGRYDASRTVYAAETGQPVTGGALAGEIVLASNKPADETGRKKITSLEVEAVIIRATIPASLSSVSPNRAHRGSELEVTVAGKNLDKAEPIASHPSLKAEIVNVEPGPEPDLKLGSGPRGTGADIFDNARPYSVKLKLAIAPDAPLGVHELFLRTPLGLTNGVAFTVAPMADTGEVEPNNALTEAQLIVPPLALAAAINASKDVDRYRVHAKAGDELVFVLTDTGLNPSLRLRSMDGVELASNDGADRDAMNRLGFRFTADGEYVIEIADRDLRENIGYRLHVGPFPYVTSVWPMGVQAGAPQQVTLEGFNLGHPDGVVAVDPPDTALNGTTMPLPVAGFEGSPIALPSLDVAPFPDVQEAESNNAPATAQAIAFPGVVNGKIESANGAGESDFYRFSARKDQLIIIEVLASRLGSKLDSQIEILDTQGSRLERAVARCLAETFLTLSPRDSRSAGLRLDNWDILRMNDFVMIGSEIIRASKLPDYGDEDVIFAAYPSGQRITYFGTTPEHHAVYTKLYKVEIAPPGTTFPPNGMPVFPLYWRNDDGFFGAGEASGDSYLEFTAPYDGEFIIKVSDALGNGGERYGYRLKLRDRAPDFSFSAGPYRVNIARGSSVPLDVRAVRTEGFSNPIRVRVEGLPDGFSCAPDVILPEDDLVRLALVAGPNVQSTPFDATFKVIAESEWEGVPIVKQTHIGVITVTEGTPDIKVNNGETRIAIAPGQSGWISVKLDRANGFNSRVPIDVLNLPYGVRILDTGLNGILVREGEYERKMEIYVEPWVKPMKRNILVQALIEAQSPMKPIFLGNPIELEIPGEGTTATAKAVE